MTLMDSRILTLSPPHLVALSAGLPRQPTRAECGLKVVPADRAVEIEHFTGVSDPYEPPLSAEVVCRTDRETPEESAARVLEVLARRLP